MTATAQTDELVARLREWAETMTGMTDLTTLAAKLLTEAATRLEASQAEIERLREALEPFAKAAEVVDSYDPEFPDEGACLRASFDYWVRHCDPDGVETKDRNSVRMSDLRRARAALESSK